MSINESTCKCLELSEGHAEELKATLRRAFEVALDGGAKLFLEPGREKSWHDALHEAAHAVAGLGTGIAVQYLSIVGPGRPYCSYDTRGVAEFPLMALLLRTVAGGVAESGGVFKMPPTWQHLAQYIEWARAAKTGTCDDCATARLLVDEFGGLPNMTLIETWLGSIHICGALFAHDEWRGALLTTAHHLQERGALFGATIDGLMGKYRLCEAREEVLGELDLWTILPAIRPSVEDLTRCA